MAKFSRESYQAAYNQKPPSYLIEPLRWITTGVGAALFSLEHIGIENIPHDGEGLIIAANHQTYLDPLLISVPIKRETRYMAWDAAFEWTVVGDVIAKLGAFPMSLVRGGTRRSLKFSIDLLEAGTALMIFPEGEREHSDGKILPFKPGAVRLAIETGVKILPVTLKGANRVWSQDMKFPQLNPISVHYHKPYRIPAPADRALLNEYVIEKTEELRSIIVST